MNNLIQDLQREYHFELRVAAMRGDDDFPFFEDWLKTEWARNIILRII